MGINSVDLHFLTTSGLSSREEDSQFLKDKRSFISLSVWDFN